MTKIYNNGNVYSKRIKARRRTYFFDIKETQGGDYYLVITESTGIMQEGRPTYRKSKIFLYKEGVKKFVDALESTFTHMKEKLLPDYEFEQADDKLDYQEEEKNGKLDR